jgi:hypothetical protein
VRASPFQPTVRIAGDREGQDFHPILRKAKKALRACGKKVGLGCEPALSSLSSETGGRPLQPAGKKQEGPQKPAVKKQEEGAKTAFPSQSSEVGRRPLQPVVKNAGGQSGAHTLKENGMSFAAGHQHDTKHHQKGRARSVTTTPSKGSWKKRYRVVQEATNASVTGSCKKGYINGNIMALI